MIKKNEVRKHRENLNTHKQLDTSQSKTNVTDKSSEKHKPTKDFKGLYDLYLYKWTKSIFSM